MATRRTIRLLRRAAASGRSVGGRRDVPLKSKWFDAGDAERKQEESTSSLAGIKSNPGNDAKILTPPRKKKSRSSDWLVGLEGPIKSGVRGLCAEQPGLASLASLVQTSTVGARFPALHFQIPVGCLTVSTMDTTITEHTSLFKRSK